MICLILLQNQLKISFYNMTFNETVVQSVTILVTLILVSWFFKKIKLLKEEQSGLFAKLITQFTLPALIFTALSTIKFDTEKLLLAVVMIISQIICAILAWLVSILFKLSRPKKGALILASTFSSSAFMGYAIVKEVYLGNSQALSDAAIVSELGVATVIFTVGVMIAIHFGAKIDSTKEKFKQSLKFFYSPIFYALVLGIVVSHFHINQEHWFIAGFYKTLAIVAGANTLLVTITIGLMLNFRDIRKVLPIVLIACVIKLFIQPMISYAQAEIFNFPTLWHQIVVLEAAMPTAALTAIFAKRYGCDVELTSILIFATFISSIFTILSMIFLLG